MEWISVKDRLPEEGLAVLVCLTSEFITVAYRSRENLKKIWQLYGPVSDILDLKNESVNYWAPLPEPPKP